MLKIEKSPPLRDQVYERLKDLLLRGEFVPGDRVTEERVAELLNVSRTPVREALGRLMQQGILERRPRGGFAVPSPSLEEMEDFIFLRQVLELAVVDKVVANSDLSDERNLTKIIKSEQRILERDDPTEFFFLTMEFWKRFWTMSGSKGLIRFLERLADDYHYQFAAVMALQDRDVRKEVIDDQKQLCQAITRKDARLAAQLVRAHLEFKKAKLVDALKKWRHR